VTHGFDANAFACVVKDSRTTSLCCVMILPFQSGSENNIVTEYFTYTPIEWEGYTPYNQVH
jgi:hypothetical protein